MRGARETAGVYQAVWTDMDTREVTDDQWDASDIGWDTWDGWPQDLKTDDGFARWGVDRLTLRLPTRGRIRPQRVASADVHWVEVTRQGLRIDFNPAQVTSLAVHPCPPGEVIQVALGVVDRLMRAVPIGAYTPDEVLNAELTRVDVARDFHDVLNIPELLDGISRLPRPRRLKFDRYNNRVVWRPNGITVGTLNQASLYDRHLLSRSRSNGKWIERRSTDSQMVPEGTLRFEARAQNLWLQGAGLKRLRDLKVEKALSLLQDRWGWSHFGTPVIGRSALLAAIEAMPWTEQAKRDHLWMEMTRKPGQPLSGTAREKREHHKRLAEIGAVTAKDFGGRIRLDLAAGTQVSC